MQNKKIHGLLVIDKPSGMTSRAVVNLVQQKFPKGTALGHTGTLDPLATGVLVICVGQATRLAEYVQSMDKVYRAEFQLGATSDTDDADGNIVSNPSFAPPKQTQIENLLPKFLGEIAQVPPNYSAAKVQGSRAYARARRGQKINLQPRKVQVYEIQINKYEFPCLDLAIRCGKGTYIRSLARDLGQELGCGAYVSGLRRLRVGPFLAEFGLSPNEDLSTFQKNLLLPHLAVSDFPNLKLGEEEIRLLRMGQSVPLQKTPLLTTNMEPCFSVWGPQGRLEAMVHVDWQKGMVNPKKIFNFDE